MNPKFWLSVGLLMSRIGVFQAAPNCQTKEKSVGGMFLRDHTFETCNAELPECFIRCAKEVTCQSFNFAIGQKVCELSNRTKDARPEDFVPDPTRLYVKRVNNRVPLGSIQELPAESCSEIKASEGNEMVNRDYWLYSDGNAQTILARCEGNWQKINMQPVCFGARDNQYGVLLITKSGLLKTMKLVHKSGSLKCNTGDPASYWGCTHVDGYGSNALMTIITNTDGNATLPPAGDLKPTDVKINHFYNLDGTTHTSSELVFPDLANKVSVSRGQELQIWYGQDWIDYTEDNNSGTSCVDVYSWYA